MGESILLKRLRKMVNILIKTVFALVVYLPLFVISFTLDYMLTNYIYNFIVMAIVILMSFVYWFGIGKLFWKMCSLKCEDEFILDFDEVKKVERVEDNFIFVWFFTMFVSLLIGTFGNLVYNILLFAIVVMYGHIEYLM